MKRLLSTFMLCAFIMANPFHVAFAKEIQKESTKQTVKQLFDQFKRDVFVKGNKLEVVTNDLVNKLLENNISTAQLQLYVAQNSSKKDLEAFNKMLSTTLEDVEELSELGQEDLSFVLESTLDATSTTGANFMSCSAGLGVGVPLVAIGVILGISALANATASKEVVTKDYIEKRQKLSTDYLNVVADLNLEIETYEADIIYYNDEIDELQRRIDSGMYSETEVEEMHQLIRDYEFFITDAQALIQEVHIDLTYFHDKYAEDSAFLDLEEVASLSEIDEKHKRSGAQAITAGIIGGVGAFFTAFGSMDCN